MGIHSQTVSPVIQFGIRKKTLLLYLSRAFFISLFGPILGKPMVLVVMLALAILKSAVPRLRSATLYEATKPAGNDNLVVRNVPV